MFFAVIPFTHSIGTEPLIYSWETLWENIAEIGSIVEIPYGNKLEHGIIAKIYQDCPFDTSSESFHRIKSVESIITTKQLLAPYQIDMIIYISQKYMIPIHRTLGIFLTKPILSRLEKKAYEQINQVSVPANIPTLHQLHILKDAIVTPSIVEPYIQWATVIILADDFALIPYMRKYQENAQVLFLKNEMTDTRKAQAWIDIKNWVFPIIYWTRKILYYNLEQYKNIVYIEDSLGADYWHYPIRIRYNDILHTFHQVNSSTSLTLLTSVPTLSTLTQFRHFDMQNITTN